MSAISWYDRIMPSEVHMVSVNIEVKPGTYDRMTCKWTCCECGREYREQDMAIVLGDPETAWMQFEEPDWVCRDCLNEAADDGAWWTQYCKDCWHVMEHDRRAQFHEWHNDCPLSKETK